MWEKKSNFKYIMGHVWSQYQYLIQEITFKYIILVFNRPIHEGHV
jgi:adenine-specific DNA methylase